MTEILLNTMSMSLFNSIKYLLTKNKNKNIIIDPISCLIKLSLFSHLDPGTKLSIFDNKINFNHPNYGQGLIRFIYGDNREDLHNLYNPIIKAIEWYSNINDKNSNLDILFNETIKGLTILKRSYNEYSTIQHTIDYYIILISNRHKQTICNGIPINRETNSKKNSKVRGSSKNNETVSIKKRVNISNNSTPKKTSITNRQESTESSDTINSKTYTNLKYKTDTIDECNSNNKSINNDGEDDINESINNNDTNNHTNNNDDTNNDDGNKSINGNSTQIFLKKLWNSNEINIIIQLFEEYNKKTEPQEKKHIYENIINYCDMKEIKLNKFLEKQSSILN